LRSTFDGADRLVRARRSSRILSAVLVWRYLLTSGARKIERLGGSLNAVSYQLGNTPGGVNLYTARRYLSRFRNRRRTSSDVDFKLLTPRRSGLCVQEQVNSDRFESWMRRMKLNPQRTLCELPTISQGRWSCHPHNRIQLLITVLNDEHGEYCYVSSAGRRTHGGRCPDARLYDRHRLVSGGGSI
jgi:hypothetical protein